MDLVGGVDSRGGYILKILHVETKESGPLGVGGMRRARPLDPPMLRLSFLTTEFRVGLSLPTVGIKRDSVVTNVYTIKK